jgi:hypothetical protein
MVSFLFSLTCLEGTLPLADQHIQIRAIAKPSLPLIEISRQVQVALGYSMIIHIIEPPN